MPVIREGDIKFSNVGTTAPATIFLDQTGTDLLRDPGLQTAVEILLGTEARALDTDVLPDQDGSRKGWWGSELLGYSLGSTSWVVGDRASITGSNLKAIEQREGSALDPLIAEGIADSVEMVATRDPNNFNRILMGGKILKKDGNSVFFNYFLNWKYELTGAL